MRAPLLFSAFLSCSFPAIAQEEPKERIIQGPLDAFTTDELGNAYVLRGDVLELFNVKGEPLQRNSLKTFGRIGTIDAFYSLKPMVFAQEQGQLAVLDNTLAVQGSVIDLPSNGFPQVTLVCASVQNGFWFFDQKELSLIRVDGQLRPLANTGRLDQLIGHAPMPTQMIERDNWLYVNDPENGILVFDLFGTYAKTIPIVGAKSFEVRGEHIQYSVAGSFNVFDMRDFTITDIANAGDPDVLDVRMEHGTAYLRFSDRLVIRDLTRK
ncbi:MAG: hypothetical protein ABI599_13455 [Flavobacteriales bacterium]